jgi:hypothetical protein
MPLKERNDSSEIPALLENLTRNEIENKDLILLRIILLTTVYRWDYGGDGHSCPGD